MVTFVVIGSCLAAMPGMFLMREYKWRRLNYAKVDRSDLFVANVIDRSGDMPSRDEILRFAKPLPENEKYFLSNLNECYAETLGRYESDPALPPLQDNLAGIDLILMDNLLETYTTAWTVPGPGGRAFTSALPFHLCENKDEIFGSGWRPVPPLEAAHAVPHWRRIIRYVRQAAPRAEIVFLCAPYCMSGDDQGRYRRSRDFYQLFRHVATSLGVRLIPPLDVDLSYTKLPDDNSHFDNTIYRAIAGHIVLCHLASLTGIAQPYELPARVFAA